MNTQVLIAELEKTAAALEEQAENAKTASAVVSAEPLNVPSNYNDFLSSVVKELGLD